MVLGDEPWVMQGIDAEPGLKLSHPGLNRGHRCSWSISPGSAVTTAKRHRGRTWGPRLILVVMVQIQ